MHISHMLPLCMQKYNLKHLIVYSMNPNYFEAIYKKNKNKITSVLSLNKKEKKTITEICFFPINLSINNPGVGQHAIKYV